MSNNIITVDVSNLIESKAEEVKKEIAILSKDFDKSRENIINVIEKGNEAINDFSEIAKQAQHPKTYEALAVLMKAVLDANKMLLEIHGINNKIDSSSRKNETSGKITTNNGNTNIIMVGSTKEVLKLLKQEEKDDL